MIQFAEESMRGELRALWKECFGDSNQYIDLYFSGYDLTRHMLVFMDGEHPVAMLSLLPMTVVTQAGIMPARYIYAVATKGAYRGRGISTKLIEYTHKYLKGEGITLSVLVPASAALYNFYGKRGFSTEFYAGRTVVERARIPDFAGSFVITETTAQEFMQIRERAFAGRTMFVRWDGDALTYRMAETTFNGGETLTLETGDSARAVAVCYNRGGSVLIKELAVDGMPLETALAVLQKKFNADEFHLVLPMDMRSPYALEKTASGAACWYDPDARDRAYRAGGAAPYISLVLD